MDGIVKNLLTSWSLDKFIERFESKYTTITSKCYFNFFAHFLTVSYFMHLVKVFALNFILILHIV